MKKLLKIINIVWLLLLIYVSLKIGYLTLLNSPLYISLISINFIIPLINLIYLSKKPVKPDMPFADRAYLIAKMNGGKCLSMDKYVSEGHALMWECSEGHQWIAKEEAAMTKWCPECYSQRHKLFSRKSKKKS